ncbi:hypothetical protein M434DRAFT_382426 [Hypoxylon sp. CO27-5]|nr:hypothetical protein M434DRAFT_382426 [Hypoxylon sp. CO27-5]
MSTESIDTSGLEGGLFAYGGNSVISCAIVFIILCTTFVALRFISHRIGRRPINLEDWLMIPTWIIMIGFCANVISVKYGDVGRHIAYVLMYEPEAFVRWAQTLFVVELLYGILFPLEKTSILLLYLRLFHVHRWFRLTTYILIVYIWLWGASEVLVAIFQCKPIQYQWDKSISGGHCINQLGDYRWVSVPNIVHDIAMLVVPAPVVWKLQIGLRQKLALSCVFLIGSIGCVASFIRLSIFFRKNALVDNTWASIELMSWTLAETGVIRLRSGRCFFTLFLASARFMIKVAGVQVFL